MAVDAEDLEPKRVKPALLPPDLSRHSIAELEGLIVLLEGEIARCRQAIAGKQSTRAAAESFFKR